MAGRFAPHLLMLAMIAIWGGSYAAVKAALGALAPFPVIAVRFWIAVLCLLPFLCGPVREQLRATRGPGLVAGSVLSVGYLLQTVGMNETSSSMGGFLAGIIVLLVAVGGSLWFGTRLGPRAVLGLLLGLCGMVLLCWPAGAPADPGAPHDTPRGIALQVGSSIAYAGHILLVSRYGRNAPAAAFCLWQLTIVGLAATAAALLQGRFAAAGTPTAAFSPWLWFQLLYLGVLATALGIGVQTKVQHKVPSTHLALLFALQPLFAALCGWWTLGDRLGALQLLGGGVIVAGVVLTSLGR
ncbi:MAG: DMT family transporter [Planctomycetes bacterium]|nr:DMT family transporter [Planctomycetota bacterium]